MCSEHQLLNKVAVPTQRAVYAEAFCKIRPQEMVFKKKKKKSPPLMVHTKI